MALDDREVRERVAQVEQRLEELEALPDATARAVAVEAVQGLLDLYGEGLARVLTVVARQGGGSVVEALAADELVSHLLLVHGLHPLDAAARVRRAVETLSPYLASQGGRVELLAVDDGVARLQLSSTGCASSPDALRRAVEEAVQQAAPELERIEVLAGTAPAARPVRFLDGSLPRGSRPASPDASWVVAGALPQLAGGGLLLKELAGQPVLFVRVGDSYQAYRPQCPACGASLGDAQLQQAVLRCQGCQHRFDLRRGGRCVEAADRALSPLPVAVTDIGLVKVALPSAVG